MNKAAIQINIASLEDIEELRNTYEEARKYKCSLGDTAWGAKPFSAKEIGEMIAQNNIYVVRIDGKHAAGFQLTLKDTHVWGTEIGNDDQAGYIHLLVTRDAYRSQQPGESIIEWVGNHLRKSGRKYTRLDCSNTNNSLCRYYEAQGFEKVGIGGNSSNPGYTPALYQKSITR